MGELLVLLVCWKWGPYGVPNQKGDSCKIVIKNLENTWELVKDTFET